MAFLAIRSFIGKLFASSKTTLKDQNWSSFITSELVIFSADSHPDNIVSHVFGTDAELDCTAAVAVLPVEDDYEILKQQRAAKRARMENL